MFHPVGSQPPSVYWRRRLIALGSAALLIVLIVLTAKTVTGDGDQAAAGSPASSGSSRPHPPATSTSTSPDPTRTATTSPATSTTHPSSSSSSSSASTSATPKPVTCVARNLALAAVVGHDSYQVGEKPLLELQVTNTGSVPCVQDLADKQIELRVYNGEARVWGSHDCQVQSGTDNRTLAAHAPVRVAIRWTGLTSRPKCAGTRQQVGAGTYTLYALLSGKTGKAAQFTIS